MSTLVDDVRAWMRNPVVANFPELLAFLRQLADRVQELEGKGEPVAWALMTNGKKHAPPIRSLSFSAPSRDERQIAHLEGETWVPLCASPPSSVQPDPPVT